MLASVSRAIPRMHGVVAHFLLQITTQCEKLKKEIRLSRTKLRVVVQKHNL
jgi:hypothetical protein